MNIKEFDTQLTDMIDILTERKNQTDIETGKKSSNTINIKSLLILTKLIRMIIETEINEVTTPVRHLKETLNADNTKHIARDMRDYFKDYGIGDFVNTKNYEILKLSGIYAGISIKAEAHYTFYINEPTLTLLYNKNIITEELYNKLLNDIPNSIQVLHQLSNKTNTTVIIRNYITDKHYIETKRDIHKDYNTMEGTYTETITSNNNGKETHIDTNTDTFIPKSSNNSEPDFGTIRKPTETTKPDFGANRKSIDTDQIILSSHNNHQEEPYVSPLDRMNDLMSSSKLSDKNQQKLDKNDNFFVKNDEKLEKNDENYIKNDKNKEEDKQYTIKTSLFNNPSNSRSGIRKRNTKNIDSKLSGNR